MFGLKKLFSNIQRLGSKRSFAYKIGQKLSHEATRQLGNLANVAGAVSAVSGGNVPLKLFADAVGSGARAGQTGIEIGKDLGAGDNRKASSRIPNLTRQVAQTGASMAGASMFIA
jgi:hypothetical protein